jgi:hypothetical protein
MAGPGAFGQAECDALHATAGMTSGAPGAM